MKWLLNLMVLITYNAYNYTLHIVVAMKYVVLKEPEECGEPSHLFENININDMFICLWTFTAKFVYEYSVSSHHNSFSAMECWRKSHTNYICMLQEALHNCLHSSYKLEKTHYMIDLC